MIDLQAKPIMKQPSDEAIARVAKMQSMRALATRLNVDYEHIYRYGHHKAKINAAEVLKQPGRHGQLVLVTAINPTPAGEGKTTVTIGLADALRRLGKEAVVAMREPSLGPVFGIKGGAAGGGYAQVVPMEDINLHFTGDIHAIGAANNLLAALLDNHIYHGNVLDIDPKRVKWRRTIDMNDRQLRRITSGHGNHSDGVLRPDGFDITVASEVMAILCLAENLSDLKQRMGQIIVAYSRCGTPVYARQLNAAGAMAALLKDAIHPNLVQTLEGTPALVHGGPFANIAHGCNSLLSTRLALHLGELTITEAGFGADLGAEKFCNIKCRKAGLKPDAVVLVATVRALKYNGGAAQAEAGNENRDALQRGLPNLLRHIRNVKDHFSLPLVVAINRFDGDTAAEINLIQAACSQLNVPAAVCDVWAHGGDGGIKLAQTLLHTLANTPNHFRLSYDGSDSMAAKINKIATHIYGAAKVNFSPQALADMDKLAEIGLGHLPVCMAKTPYSFTDDAAQLGAPSGFTLHARAVEAAAGAGFAVVLCGNIMRMPGLPKTPAAEKMDIDEYGQIHGLF